MTEIQIQNGCWQRPETKFINEKDLKTAKLYYNGTYWRLEKVDVDGKETKAKVQTTVIY